MLSWFYHTYNSLTGPCRHHKYVLKTNISACSHFDACFRTESGRIIRSSNLWFTGSSELDSTSNGAQRNSTVALYSCKSHKDITMRNNMKFSISFKSHDLLLSNKQKQFCFSRGVNPAYLWSENGKRRIWWHRSLIGWNHWL